MKIIKIQKEKRKTMSGVVASVCTWQKVRSVSNFTQQLSTTRTNMRQGVQTDSTSVTSTMLRPFALCVGLWNPYAMVSSKSYMTATLASLARVQFRYLQGLFEPSGWRQRRFFFVNKTARNVHSWKREWMAKTVWLLLITLWKIPSFSLASCG